MSQIEQRDPCQALPQAGEGEREGCERSESGHSSSAIFPAGSGQDQPAKLGSEPDAPPCQIGL